MATDPFKRYNTKPQYLLRGESEEHSLERASQRINKTYKDNPGIPLLRWISIGAAAVLLVFAGKYFMFPTDPNQMAEAFYEQYPNYVTLSVRGETANTPSAYRSYDQGALKQASIEFSTMSMDAVDSFYYAVTLAGVGDWDQSRAILSELHELPLEYAAAHEWYSALALLENGEQVGATQKLESLAAGESPFSTKARELMRALE